METKKDNMDYSSMEGHKSCSCPNTPIGHTPAIPMPNMPGTTPAIPMPNMPGTTPAIPMPPGCIMPPGCMPAPGYPPMPPIEDPQCNHIKKMYCFHMHMAYNHKSEAYKHKMMYYDHCFNIGHKDNCDC